MLAFISLFQDSVFFVFLLASVLLPLYFSAMFYSVVFKFLFSFFTCSAPTSCSGNLFVNFYLCLYRHVRRLFPIFHSLHCLSFLFLSVYFLCSFLCPLCVSFSKIEVSSDHLTKIPVPSCSLSSCLDKPLSYFLCSKRLLKVSHFNTKFFSTFLLLLLILAGDVELNPGPMSSLSASCLNIRSASSVTPDLDKPTCLKEFIIDNSLDLLSLTETWLHPDTSSEVLNSLTPNNYSIISSPRAVGRGGGIAVIYKSSLQVSSLSLTSFASFEVLGLKVVAGNFTCNFFTIYRPPSSSLSTFFDDFFSLLVDVSSSACELLLSGDFNIHVDDLGSSYTQSFLNLLDTFGLHQHIGVSTHSSGHTLDLLISRSDSTLITNPTLTDPCLSDHSAVCFTLPLPCHVRPPHRTFSFRNISKIDLKLFSDDIRSSDLYTLPVTTLSEFLFCFKSVVTTVLNKHAPLISVNCSTKHSQPFITPEIRKAKSLRSRLETIWRKSKSTLDKDNFKKQSKVLNKLLTAAKRSYYRNLVSDSKNNSKKLWANLNSILNRSSRSTLPTFVSGTSMATSFLNFFSDKISVLHSKLKPDSTSPHSPPPPHNPPSFTHFSRVTEDEIRAAILSSSNSSCALDFIPTKLLKSCLDVFLPPICTLINLCIYESSVPDDFKSAIVTPLLKKFNLPREELSSYRPISNLNFISKILERVMYNQLMSHLNSFPSFSRFQSAYRKFHSVETALTRIHSDLLLSFERKQVSALVLLDMSAAFDTVNHKILLERLILNFGIHGSALCLLGSYLSGRTQAVSVDSNLSDPSILTSGVPQGSVLGPLLFSLYTTPLSYQLDSSNLSYHFYADDTQLYISFKANESTSSLGLLSDTLDGLHKWLSRNSLSLNPSKTEFLLIGSPQQRSKLSLTSFSFSGTTVSCSLSVRNLGVIFDSDLSFKDHVTQVSKSCHHHIRQLRSIRPLLDHDTAVLLANSLVASKLDFCNALYAGLPNVTINRLQLVQNSLARTVYSSRKFDHASPLLRQLHWLPISQRISYKIALLTFRTLQLGSPSYLSVLLVPYKSSRNLRSDNKNLLVIPPLRSSAGRKSFSFFAPTLWNSLPLSLRSASSLSSFRSNLKTYLYPP